jgi:hypothetical protein
MLKMLVRCSCDSRFSVLVSILLFMFEGLLEVELAATCEVLCCRDKSSIIEVSEADSSLEEFSSLLRTSFKVLIRGVTFSLCTRTSVFCCVTSLYEFVIHNNNTDNRHVAPKHCNCLFILQRIGWCIYPMYLYHVFNLYPVME